MSYFKVIIPNYNSEKFINKTLFSILDQTFQDFDIIIVDDMSTDDSVKIIKKLKDKRIHLVENKEKRYNGGGRNVGIDYPIKSKYTLFLDCDDWFNSKDCFQKIYEKCEETKADCITLPYIIYNGEKHYFELKRNTPEDLVHDLSVACWTKCIKSELVVHFPENTLMEDVSQHIEQCDCIETCDSLDSYVVVWNRANKNSISQKPNKKRKSSEWRQLADVVDLDLVHDYCIEEQEKRVQEYLEILLSGRHVWEELSR